MLLIRLREFIRWRLRIAGFGFNLTARSKTRRFPARFKGYPVHPKSFPVPVRGEFVPNCLERRRNSVDAELREARIRSDSLYFSCITGIRPRDQLPLDSPHRHEVLRSGDFHRTESADSIKHAIPGGDWVSGREPETAGSRHSLRRAARLSLSCQNA